MQTQSSSPQPAPPAPARAPSRTPPISRPRRSRGRWRLRIQLAEGTRWPSFATKEEAQAARAELLAAWDRGEPLNVKLERPVGFARLGRAERQSVAAAGGREAQRRGTAHRFTQEEIQSAGRLGGAVVRERFGREYFRELGARGGHQRAARLALKEKERP